LIFGGYASHLGFTEQCTFTNNILYGNETSIAVQKSRNNTLKNNIIIGGWEAIDFNGEMQANNDFQANYWENSHDDADYFNQLNELPEAQRNAQEISQELLTNPENGDFSLKNAPSIAGTTWRPNAKYMTLYAEYIKAQERANEAAAYLQSKAISSADTANNEAACEFFTEQLHLGGHKETRVARVLKQAGGLYMLQVVAPYGENAYAQATTSEGVRIV